MPKDLLPELPPLPGRNRAGQVDDLVDHYRIFHREDGKLWELGHGAMGVTYKALDTNLDKAVALKIINSQFLGKESSRQRFRREARSAASLHHRHIATVYHLGESAGNFYYAMEFVDGETVEALVQRTGPLPWRKAFAIALQIARALMAAHAGNLVHRDIKPANIMVVDEVDEKDVVKLIDFGLAKSAAEAEGSQTASNASGFLGTPLYASPEQCEELPADIRSDIYSLGVTLWYMLMGHPPFEGNLGYVFHQQLYATPPFEKLPAGLPPAVRALLQRMLSKDRAQRPQTPASLRGEIEALLQAPDRAVSEEENAVETDPVPSSRWPLGWGAREIWAGAALLAVMAAAAVLLFHGGSDRTGPSDTGRKTGPGRVSAGPSAAGQDPAPSVTPDPAAAQRTAADLIDRGRQARVGGDLRGALSLLREAAAADPANLQTAAEMALTYEAMKLPDKAAEQWTRVYAGGESIGALYHLADARLHGPSPAAATPGNPVFEGETALKVTDTHVLEIKDPAVEQKYTLKITVKGRPGVVIDPSRVQVAADFYDSVNGSDIVPTTAQTHYAWLGTAPITWANDRAEALEAIYLRPRRIPPPERPGAWHGGSHPVVDGNLNQAGASGRGGVARAATSRIAAERTRTYFGYVVRVYYKSQLQDAQADPSWLAQKFPPIPTLPSE